MSFGDKNSSIYVADSRIDQRMTIRDALKELGFTNVKIGGSVKEIIDLLQTDEKPADWIIASLMLEEELNALHLLALCVKETSLHKTKTSFVVSPEEKVFLPKAFELGLLSFHLKPFTKASLQNELKALVERVSNDATSGCLASASFLKEYMMDAGDFTSTIKLLESLIRLYPDNAQLFVDLAEAQQLAGNGKEALRTLAQAKHLGVNLAKAAKQLEQLILSEQPPANGADPQKVATDSFASAFGIENIVVIDPDQSIQNILSETMKELGVKQTLIFADGESAWDWMKDNTDSIHLIIQEWRVPKLSSPALIQRYGENGITAPVIVFSALVKNSDKPLLREIGVAHVIEKPLTREYFTPQFMACIRQERFPTSYKTMARQFQQAAAAKNKTLAKDIFDRLIAMKDVPHETLLLVRAEWLFLLEDYDGAKALVLEAMGAGGDSLRLLNLLGKIFMKLRNFEDAIKCMNKAQHMSSHNLERLCSLAEAQAEVGDLHAAKDTIDQAKSLDAGSSAVIATEVKVALTSGNTQLAKSLTAKLESLGEIIAYTNNRAVSLSRQNRLKDAIDLYETARQSLPDGEQELASKLSYNLALGYIRSGEMGSALKCISGVAGFTSSSIHNKIKSLTQKLEQSVASGKSIQIKASEESMEIPVPKASVDKPAASIVAIDIRPGDLCCHLIFTTPLGTNQVAEKFLAKLPNFAPRKPLTVQR